MQKSILIKESRIWPLKTARDLFDLTRVCRENSRRKSKERRERLIDLWSFRITKISISHFSKNCLEGLTNFQIESSGRFERFLLRTILLQKLFCATSSQHAIWKTAPKSLFSKDRRYFWFCWINICKFLHKNDLGFLEKEGYGELYTEIVLKFKEGKWSIGRNWFLPSGDWSATRKR